MGLRINTNVASLQAQHGLDRSSKRLGVALERLSTGLRINHASDDVVGLLKSENLRSQIRGIAVAKTNASNALSALQSAEGGLSQLTEISQRIREYVLTAADENISASDRSNIETSVSDLTNEFNRIAQATEFDGNNLLTGNYTGKDFQIGPRANNYISISIDDARASAIGQVYIMTSTTATNVDVTGAESALSALSTTMEINDISLSTSDFADDGVSNQDGAKSALAFVNAINNISGSTGVTAQVLTNSVTFTYATNTLTAIDSAEVFQVNGQTVAAGSGYTNSDAGMTSFINAVNDLTTQTGVVASIDTTNNTITLSANDGRNVDINWDTLDTIAAAGSTATGISTTRAIFGVSTNGVNATSAAGSADAVYRGQFKLFSDDAFTVQNAGPEIAADDDESGTLSTASALNDVNVGSAANATEGLFILDNVIRQLQNRRSDVGSKTIRMEIAVSELDIRSEAFSQAESTIRDADIAKETAELTSAQILQQAGASVLQRANSLPQIALTLLQG